MLGRARASIVDREDHADIPSVVTLRHERCDLTSDERWRRSRILVATATCTSTPTVNAQPADALSGQ